MDVEELLRAINYIEGVTGTHNYHVWSISNEEHALMIHVVFSMKYDEKKFKRNFHKKFEHLMKKYKIKYYTVQVEVEGKDALV